MSGRVSRRSQDMRVVLGVVHAHPGAEARRVQSVANVGQQMYVTELLHSLKRSNHLRCRNGRWWPIDTAPPQPKAASERRRWLAQAPGPEPVPTWVAEDIARIAAITDEYRPANTPRATLSGCDP